MLRVGVYEAKTRLTKPRKGRKLSSLNMGSR